MDDAFGALSSWCGGRVRHYNRHSLYHGDSHPKLEGKVSWLRKASHLSTSKIQWTTGITETGITNLTRIMNEMATSSDYLMKYFNGFLAVLLV